MDYADDYEKHEKIAILLNDPMTKEAISNIQELRLSIQALLDE